MSTRFDSVFGNAPTTRVGYWMRSALVGFSVPGIIFLVTFGAFSAARDHNALGSIALIASGVASISAIIFILGSEQRNIAACWKAARDSGANSIYVFARGWRTGGGRDERLQAGWIGTNGHDLIVVIGAGKENSLSLSTHVGDALVSRRVVLNGLAYSQLEVAWPGFEASFELVKDRRLLFSFLTDNDVDDVVSELRASAGRA